MKSKSPEKEAEIYRVVLEITAKVGLAGLKMSNIAKEAGLAHGTVYIYFKNKKDLINQLFKKAKKRASKSVGFPEVERGNFLEALKTTNSVLCFSNKCSLNITDENVKMLISTKYNGILVLLFR